jgi:hypothetical protein
MKNIRFGDKMPPTEIRGVAGSGLEATIHRNSRFKT